MSDHEPVTEIGAPVKKPFGKTRGGRPGIGVGDFDAVVRSAYQLARGNARALTAVSLDDMRVLFDLAAVGGTGLQLVADLIAASDAAATPDVIFEKLRALTDFVRPMMEKPPCKA